MSRSKITDARTLLIWMEADAACSPTLLAGALHRLKRKNSEEARLALQGILRKQEREETFSLNAPLVYEILQVEPEIVGILARSPHLCTSRGALAALLRHIRRSDATYTQQRIAAYCVLLERNLVPSRERIRLICRALFSQDPVNALASRVVCADPETSPEILRAALRKFGRNNSFVDQRISLLDVLLARLDTAAEISAWWNEFVVHLPSQAVLRYLEDDRVRESLSIAEWGFLLTHPKPEVRLSAMRASAK